MLYQDQLAIIGDLSGPGRLRPLPFLQSLLAADLTVCFPTWKTLRAEGGKKTLVGEEMGDNERAGNGTRRQEKGELGHHREVTT